MSEITERVEAGAALLDEKLPGWWREIDLEKLNLASRCNCVLGQLNGATANTSFAYSAAAAALGVGYMDEIPLGFEAPSVRGFGSERNAQTGEYRALTAAWRDLITSRRAAAEVTA